MEEGEKFRRNRTETDPLAREEKARENLEQYVKRTARATNKPEDQVRSEFDEQAASHPYRVEFEDYPGGAFYRVEQIGLVKVLRINREHRFYTDVYAAPDSNRVVRAGLEVLLFSIGTCELDALGNADKSTFYAVERVAWSEVLTGALGMLSRFVHDTDLPPDDDEIVEDADSPEGKAA
jgi:hypothetical protein